MTSSTTPLVHLDAASKKFGKNLVLHDLSLTVPPSQLIAVLGSNGAGKTTLLRIIAGLLGLDQGTLLLDGQELDRLSEKQREKLFFLPDFPSFFEEHTLLENLEIWLGLYGQDQAHREDELIALLDRFHLAEKVHQPVALLSRGQRFKLALVLFEGSQAPLGLLDEPFASGMDASGLNEMRHLLRDLVTKENRSVIYTTQLVKYALEFADRILVIDHQQIYFDGSPDQFKAKSDDKVLQQFSE